MPNNPEVTEVLARLWKPLLGLTIAVAALHLYFLFRTNINWDEFRYLSEIYAIQGGYGSAGLNDLHALLYGWLTLLPFNEIGQIITARVVQLGLFLAAMVMLYRIFRDLLHPTLALAATFLATCYSAIVLHASSFRFDTLCLFFSVLALLCLFKGRTWQSALLGGLALAASILVSTKTALWAPLFLGVGLTLLLASNDRSREIKRLSVFALATIVGFAVLFGLHSLVGNTAGEAAAGKAVPIVASLKQTAYAMFLSEGLFPRFDYLVRGITENPAHWLLLLIGSIAAIRQLYRGNNRRASIIALLFLTPLLTVAIYRNAFPYFYVYALPPAMLVGGIGLRALANRVGKTDERLYQLLVMIPVLFGLVTSTLFLAYHQEGIDKQRTIVDAVHEMFPEPVPYIGAHGMIASFQRVGPFMSTWGMTRYHERGEPIFARAIEEHQPKFVIANHPAFFFNLEMNADDPEQVMLLAEDEEAIRQNFIEYWGPISIAGKEIETRGMEEPIPFQILIPGDYMVESETPVQVNGNSIDPGAAVLLEEGWHEITGPEYGLVTLRWGDDFTYPEEFAPREWMYDGL